MTSALEQTDDRFGSVFGVARGGGLARSNSFLASPGREGILDFLYEQLPHVPESARFQSFGLRYVMVRCVARTQQLTIYDFAATRREVLAYLDRVTTFNASHLWESSLYVVDTERDERACVWLVAPRESRRAGKTAITFRAEPKHAFCGAPRSLLILVADA